MKRILLCSFISACAIFVLLCLAGCQTLEAPQTPYAEWVAPDSDTTSVAAATPAIYPSENELSSPMTLAGLIDYAARRNPATLAAWADARAAMARVGEMSSKYYPQATAAGRLGQGKTDENMGQEPGDAVSFTQYGPQLSLTWLLLDAGGRSASVEQQKQLLLSSNYQFNQALQDLVLAVESAFFGLFAAMSGVEAAQASLEDAKTNLDAAQKRLEAGLDTRLSVLQAEATRDNALYELAVAQGEVHSAQAALAQALGVSADVPIQIEDPNEDVPASLSKEDISTLIAEALSQRSDIRAIRAEVAATEAAVRAAKSALWPSLSLGADGEKYWYKYSGTDLDNNDTYSLTGYLNLEWNFFEGFANVEKKREAQANLAAQRAQLIKAEVDASADVWTKFYAYDTARHKYSFSRASLNSSKESYDLALQGFKAGLNSMLDLLDAQSKLSEARSKVIGARRDVYVSLAELAHAQGRLHLPAVEGPVDDGQEPESKPAQTKEAMRNTEQG